MKRRAIIALVVGLILTGSSFFVPIIPCRSWYGSNMGADDLTPFDTFCRIFFGVGPHNDYFYFSSNPATATIVTFFLLFLLSFIFLTLWEQLHHRHLLYPITAGVYFLSIIIAGLLFPLKIFIDTDPVMGGLATAMILGFIVTPLFIIGSVGLLMSIFIRMHSGSATTKERVLFWAVIASYVAIPFGMLILGWGI